VSENVTEEQRKELSKKLEENLTSKLEELDELYKTEIKEAKDNKKKLAEIENLFKENKDSLNQEFNRLKSIVSDLHFASTILESDYRNIFCQYSDIISFVS